VVSLKLCLLDSRISRIKQNAVSNVANSSTYHPFHGKRLYSDADITSVWENRCVMSFFGPPIVDILMLVITGTVVVTGIDFRTWERQ
jgi:hypothetical protein